MPIYEYHCATCGVIFEKRQSFSDPPVSKYVDCPHKHQGCNIRRLVSTPAIVFKGSGFYVTDSRASNRPKDERKSPKEAADKDKKSKSAKSKDG
jgi:putative FmdB family regulatory protein